MNNLGQHLTVKCVDVLVKLIILKLSPVLNSMVIVFHRPVVSGSQVIEQGWPSIKIFPGPGLVGFGSACTDMTASKANAKAASIFFSTKAVGEQSDSETGLSKTKRALVAALSIYNGYNSDLLKDNGRKTENYGKERLVSIYEE